MDKFWDTEIGKIMSHGLHEHNTVLGQIARSRYYIEHKFDSLTKEQILIQINNIEEGKKKAQEAMDFIYEKLKALSI
jgi:hypothetical protein